MHVPQRSAMQSMAVSSICLEKEAYGIGFSEILGFRVRVFGLA